MSKRPYATPGRLADILALIQVLAFDPDTHRSEAGVKKEMGGRPPFSSDEWTILAKEHSEFFRVSNEAEHAVSLVARHVQSTDDPNRKREPLSPEFTQVLIRTAIELHDREIAVAERWKTFIPIWSTLIASILVLITSLILHFAAPTKASNRFVPTKTFGDVVLLDTATGKLCYTEGMMKVENLNLPGCPELH